MEKQRGPPRRTISCQEWWVMDQTSGTLTQGAKVRKDVNSQSFAPFNPPLVPQRGFKGLCHCQVMSHHQGVQQLLQPEFWWVRTLMQ